MASQRGRTIARLSQDSPGLPYGERRGNFSKTVVGGSCLANPRTSLRFDSLGSARPVVRETPTPQRQSSTVSLHSPDSRHGPSPRTIPVYLTPGSPAFPRGAFNRQTRCSPWLRPPRARGAAVGSATPTLVRLGSRCFAYRESRGSMISHLESSRRWP